MYFLKGSQNNHQVLNKPVFGVQPGSQMQGFAGQPAPQPLMQQGMFTCNDLFTSRYTLQFRKSIPYM